MRVKVRGRIFPFPTSHHHTSAEVWVIILITQKAQIEGIVTWLPFK
jgi:hypothetical protein